MTFIFLYLSNVRNYIQLVVSSYHALFCFAAQTAWGATGVEELQYNQYNYYVYYQKH